MNPADDIDPVERFRDTERVGRAIARATREAVRVHKLLGHSIPTWRDGKVVWIPPEEIVIPPEIPDDGTSSTEKPQ